MKDIAEKAGFSITTVSRALGGYDDVNEQTRERIVEIARQLGYQPNLVARQLRSQRTETIGIIPPVLPNSDDDFFSILIKGASHTVAQQNYDLLIGSQLSNDVEMQAYHRLVGGNRVDGMVLARPRRNDPRIEYLQSIGHPFVVAGSTLDPASTFPYIDMDNRAAIRLLVQHFVDYGHQNIGIILSPPEMSFTHFRLLGYEDGLAANNLPAPHRYRRTGDLTVRGGYEAAIGLLDEPITALIACNDLMAIGAMRAIQERGWRVGHDIAVGGVDDIPIAGHTTPPLTTIRQPIYEIGEKLTSMLLRIISRDPVAQPQRLLDPELVIRESSGNPR